jgi:rhodanese-related sulfurtransferase
MKRLIIIPFMLLFLLFSCTAQEDELVSGTLKGGLRYLSINSKNKPLNYVVYRGDYLVFELKDDSALLSIPELEVNLTLPRPESEQPYVKMKQTGTFAFTLGERRGTIEVIELAEAHYAEFSAAEAADFINQTAPLILDVRTADEYKSVHIPGAMLIPVQILSENLSKLEDYKDQDVFLYCASGNRSTVASRILIDAGFTRVYNLRFGIGDWARKGYPVE